MSEASETSGVWGREDLDLVDEISRRTAEMTHEPRLTAAPRQRISRAVPRDGYAYHVSNAINGHCCMIYTAWSNPYRENSLVLFDFF